MSIPTLDEQFLPRLVCVFYAIFHPTEGPKVVYQVPEGSISHHRTEHASNKIHAPNAPSSSSQHSAAETQPPPTGKPAEFSTGQAHHNTNQLLTGEPLFDFASLSEYLIPKAPLCGRLVACTARGSRRNATLQKTSTSSSEPVPSRAGLPSSPSSHRSASPSSAASDHQRRGATPPLQRAPLASARTYKILGHPILIEDAARYRRNNFIFNLCFVFEGRSDVRAYEPVVRKCGRVLRGLEESQSFLSNPKSMQRVYGIIEQLYEDLNSYCESFVALPEAPYTSYINSASSPTLHKLASPIIGPYDFLSLGASAASLRDEHHRKVLAQHLRQLQISPTKSLGGDPRSVQTPLKSRSRATSNTDSPTSALSPLSAIRPDAPKRTLTTSETSPTAKSASSLHSPEGGPSRRLPLSRSATLATINGLNQGGPVAAASSSLTKASSEGRFASLGRVSAEEQSELAKELMASENATISAPAGAGKVDDAEGTRSGRRSSGGSVGHVGDGTEHQMVDSIVSLRTIDAALSNSIQALRQDASASDTRAVIAEKREPPHGLGRTVRDAINLKLFPTYPNPPPVNDWDVPVALLDLGSRVDGNWDLTMARIFPYIDGVNHVKRIAQLSDADLSLTRSCMEHLLYYGCIIMIDIFQYFNMYTVRPAIASMADDEAMGRECATYVTRPGYPLPSYPELLRLYSLLRPGRNLHDWIEENEVDAKGIDVRRFVSFGVIQGFLRRVHRFPVYLSPPPPAIEDGESRLDQSLISSTVRNSPMFGSADLGSKLRREQSGSREPRDRRPREFMDIHAAASSSGRVLKDGNVESRRPDRSQTPQRQSVSDFAALEGSTTPSETASRTAARLGGSPTKKAGARLRSRATYHHPTTTVIDVASVAFDIRDSTRKEAAPTPGPRSPRKRTSTHQSIGLGSAGVSGFGSTTGGARGASTGAGASGISQSQRSTVVVPPELAEMLDGSRCDDELCISFGVGWPDLEKMLIQLGTGGRDGRLEDCLDDEGGGASGLGLRGSDWRRGAATGAHGGGGASSEWSRAGRMSGFGSGIYSQGKSGGAVGGESGGGGGGGRSSGTGTKTYPDKAPAPTDSSILIHSGQGGGGASGWGAGSEDATGAGWSGFGGLERQAIEAGDLGRVKVMLQ